MTATPTPILDHIVILVPHATLVDLPNWLTEAFTVLPGGRHADGVTENKLILFQDGVYLELIAFSQSKEALEGRKHHRWGQRHEGHIVDWANTLHEEGQLDFIRERVASAGSGIKYSEPQAGGRIKPDGTELKWVISAPFTDDTSGEPTGFVGGEAPFWCLDRTPRDLRVPYRVGHNVQHPSGALGVAGLSVSVRNPGVFDRLKSTYDALQGHQGTQQEKTGASKAFSWSLQVPAESLGGKSLQRSLSLALIDGSEALAKSLDVDVELSLASSTQEGTVSGQLGDKNWLIKFDLLKA